MLRCVEALKRQLWNVHSRNIAPRVVASVRSTSVKVHSSKTDVDQLVAVPVLAAVGAARPRDAQTSNVPPLRQ